MRINEQRRFGVSWRVTCTMSVLFAFLPSAIAQQTAAAKEPPAAMSADSVSDSVRELREQVRALQAAVAGMRSDWQQARQETAELRRELDTLRAGKESMSQPADNAAESQAGPNAAQADHQAHRGANQQTGEPAATLEEQYQLLSGKIDDQYQTKVESASKYRVRLSGIVLLNMFSNQGTVDSSDLPTVAYARGAGESGGSFGATLRQSEIGLEAFGPSVAGAKTKADFQLDLAGGFPTVPNGVNSGLMRLRTATMRMDWTNTSVVAGQDAIFFSPNSPTSFASLAIPALSAAGNLWGWVPQIRVEHRAALGEDSTLLFQGGILDPVSGEVPNSTAYRGAGPGEESRQPAYATRFAWMRNISGEPFHFGAGAFYSRQDYGFSRNVDAWAVAADLELPLNREFSLSGKVYRGRALGGFYGGIGRSVLFNGDPALSTSEVEALNSVGGWAQLKYRPANKWEFNAAFGMDNPFAADLKYFRYAQAYGDPTLARNQGSFVNMIYRPRSDLLFSAEYRHLTTYSLTDGGNNAGQLNLMMGVLF